MKIFIRIISVLLGIAGFIWFFQGIGVIGGSFMTSQTKWAVIGAILLVFSAILWWRSNAKRE